MVGRNLSLPALGRNETDGSRTFGKIPYAMPRYANQRRDLDTIFSRSLFQSFGVLGRHELAIIANLT